MSSLITRFSAKCSGLDFAGSPKKENPAALKQATLRLSMSTGWSNLVQRRDYRVLFDDHRDQSLTKEEVIVAGYFELDKTSTVNCA